MTIDDIPRPAAFSADHWRGVLHDVIDEVLDRILEAAGDAPDTWTDDGWPDDGWPDDEDDEPPGDLPPAGELAAVGEQLRASLGAAIERGTRLRGCDGTLRCTRAWAERYGASADRIVEHYRRSGVRCDCAVLRTVLGRTDLRPRCPLRSAPEGGASPDRPRRRGRSRSKGPAARRRGRRRRRARRGHR